jgi:general secretion pathway protein C
MPRQIHILFNLLALFVITYIVVDTFYRVIGIELHQIGGRQVVALKEAEVRGEKSLTAPEFTKIVERNIFGATEKVEAPVEEVGPIEVLEETSLQLSLLGTIAGDTDSGRAIILDQRKRSQDIYRVGDSVQEAEIRQILRGKVILRHGEKDEVLLMVEGDEKEKSPKPKTAAKADRRRRPGRRTGIPARTSPNEEVSQSGEVEEETISISQEVLQNSMNNINDLMTQVKVRPYFRRGKSEGLIVSQIQTGSVFANLGLMNGDIISSVNGKKMSSPEEAIGFYNSLKSGGEVNIEITRRGKKKMLNYDIQ